MPLRRFGEIMQWCHTFFHKGLQLRHWKTGMMLKCYYRNSKQEQGLLNAPTTIQPCIQHNLQYKGNPYQLWANGLEASIMTTGREAVLLFHSHILSKSMDPYIHIWKHDFYFLHDSTWDLYWKPQVVKMSAGREASKYIVNYEKAR